MQNAFGKLGFAVVMVTALVAGTLAPRVASSQGNESTLTAPQIRDLVKGMGYETKDLNTEEGKEKYEFSLEKSDLNIPISLEVSPSKRYIWFTVYLGDATKLSDLGGRCEKLIRQNSSVQPTQFYITKSDRLMLALAIENRGPVDAAMVRKAIDKVSEDVADSRAIWGE